MAEQIGRIEIVNWDKFQHYGKRRPPWIKLHRSLLDKREWHAMSGDACKLLAACWLIASEHEKGWIELSTTDLAWRLRRSDAPRVAALLKELSLLKFVALIDHDASAVLAPCSQDASLETEERERQRQSSVLSEQAAAPPEEEAEVLSEAFSRAQFAVLTRKHLWLGPEPPAALLAKKPDWTMGNEITIGEQLSKDYGWPAIAGCASLVRTVLNYEADKPLSWILFHAKDKRHHINEVINVWQKQQLANAAKPKFGIVA